LTVASASPWAIHKSGGTPETDDTMETTSSWSPYVVDDPEAVQDPRLVRLADALLVARREYTTMATRGFGDRPSDLHHARQRYAHAALRYCTALQATGVDLPHGLSDTARWLLANGDARS
jgi:hypothetical protein